MPFPRTQERIRECERFLGLLRDAENNPPNYRALTNATINCIRSVWDSLRTEGASIPGFRQWRKRQWKKQLAMTPSFLMVDKSRIEYFHKGDKTVRSTAHYASFHVDSTQNASLLEITSEGILEQTEEGFTYRPDPKITVTQAIQTVPPGRSNVRLIGGPIQVEPGATVHMENVDVTDHGKVSPQNQKSALDECRAAVVFINKVVAEAERTFGRGR